MQHALLPLITSDDMKLPFYVTSVGGRIHQEHIIRLSGYKDYHWLHSTSGTGKLIIYDKEYYIEEGSGFLMPPELAHEYMPISSKWETRWITFNGYATEKTLDFLSLNEWGFYKLINLTNINSLLIEIYNTVLSDIALRNFECSVLLYRFISEIKNLANIKNSNMKISRQKQLYPAIKYMESNYQTSPYLKDLAKLVGVSSQHFCRLFKQTLNLKPFEYLTMIRIQRAKEILLNPERLPLKDICESVGINDVSYFCLIFRKHEGISPIEFREQHRMW